MASILEPLLADKQAAQKSSQSFLQRGWVRRLAVIVVVLVVAVILTYELPVGTHLPCPWCGISSMIGWSYMAMWTISFYPQLIINFRRKSVEGLSLDFMLMNIAGFTCYTIFNVAMVSSKTVKAEYQERFGTVGVPVELNDVLFGAHALLLSLALAVQCIIYPRSASQKVALSTTIGLSASTLVGIAFAAILAIKGEQDQNPWTWLDLCYYCSFVKMGVTLVKYIPQVHLNRTRQSTDGWSIDNVLLDLGGGMLSTAQLLISCQVLHDWSSVTGNPIKFGLGLTSIGFDFVFILQHYVWYRNEAPVLLVAAAQQQQQADEDVVIVIKQAGGSQGGAGESVPLLHSSAS